MESFLDKWKCVTWKWIMKDFEGVEKVICVLVLGWKSPEKKKVPTLCVCLENSVYVCVRVCSFLRCLFWKVWEFAVCYM